MPPKKINYSERPAVVPVHDGPSGASLLSVMWQAREGSWDDDDVLLMLAEIGSSSEPAPSRIEALSGAVAGQIMRAGIPTEGDALDISLSVARLIDRNLSGVGGIFDRTTYKEVDRDTLVSAWRQLRGANMPNARIRRGLELGDRALHYRAGVGSKHLRRVMSDSAFELYTKGFAMKGYAAALETAGSIKSATAKEVQMSVPTLVTRFDDVVSIVRGLMESRDKRLARLN